MNKPHLRLLPLAVIAVAFAGCERKAAVPDDATLFQVLQDNASALEKKDVEAVMATIHPEAPSYKEIRPILAPMFRDLDLKYSLNDLRVVTSSEDEATVSFVQTTQKTGGSGAFQDNIVTGIDTLRPDHGKWKIYWTVQSKVTDLHGHPLGGAPPAPPTAPAAAAPAATPPPPPGSPLPAAASASTPPAPPATPAR